MANQGDPQWYGELTNVEINGEPFPFITTIGGIYEALTPVPSEREELCVGCGEDASVPNAGCGNYHGASTGTPEPTPPPAAPGELRNYCTSCAKTIYEGEWRFRDGDVCLCKPCKEKSDAFVEKYLTPAVPVECERPHGERGCAYWFLTYHREFCDPCQPCATLIDSAEYWLAWYAEGRCPHGWKSKCKACAGDVL